jgi:RNA polymerase sigma-70 factor (ECF subfamily)
MTSRGSVTGLFGDLRSSEPHVRDAAAQAIWDRFTVRLLALCGQSLSRRIRAKVDPDDVVQDAYRSFFHRQERGQFDLKNRLDLWNMLVTITLRKARNLANYYTAGVRDVGREQPQSDGEDGEGGALRPPLWMLERMDRSEPTPAEAALFNEEFELRLAALPDGLRRIALWKLEGHTNAQIAEWIKRTERTVENELSRIRRRWAKDGATGAEV